MTTTWRTTDGVPVEIGLRVFTTDMKWGTVDEEPDFEGWFHVKYDDGGKAVLNGERVASRKPGWVK